MLFQFNFEYEKAAGLYGTVIDLEKRTEPIYIYIYVNLNIYIYIYIFLFNMRIPIRHAPGTRDPYVRAWSRCLDGNCHLVMSPNFCRCVLLCEQIY